MTMPANHQTLTRAEFERLLAIRPEQERESARKVIDLSARKGQRESARKVIDLSLATLVTGPQAASARLPTKKAGRGGWSRPAPADGGGRTQPGGQ
jgi:hypothetical protein